MLRKFGMGQSDKAGYAAGVRLGQKKTAKWLNRKSGGRCMTADVDDLGEAEGGKARQHLGRPGRKAGGSVKREWGGPATLKDVPEIANAAATGVGASVAAKAMARKVAPSKPENERVYSGKLPYADGTFKDDDSGRACGGRAYAKGGFLKGIKKGALRAEMGVKSGDKIPAKKLDKATHSSNPLLKKRAVLAKNMRSWNKG